MVTNPNAVGWANFKKSKSSAAATLAGLNISDMVGVGERQRRKGSGLQQPAVNTTTRPPIFQNSNFSNFCEICDIM
jgi:hypothetical protein